MDAFFICCALYWSALLIYFGLWLATRGICDAIKSQHGSDDAL